LKLLVSRLQDFADQVKAGLQELSWEQRREVIRTLVKKIEIGEAAIRIVYRVSLPPFAKAPKGGLWQDCSNRQRETAEKSPSMAPAQGAIGRYKNDRTQPLRWGWDPFLSCFARSHTPPCKETRSVQRIAKKRRRDPSCSRPRGYALQARAHRGAQGTPPAPRWHRRCAKQPPFAAEGRRPGRATQRWRAPVRTDPSRSSFSNKGLLQQSQRAGRTEFAGWVSWARMAQNGTERQSGCQVAGKALGRLSLGHG
jgi:hypothetical protein